MITQNQLNSYNIYRICQQFRMNAVKIQIKIQKQQYIESQHLNQSLKINHMATVRIQGSSNTGSKGYVFQIQQSGQWYNVKVAISDKIKHTMYLTKNQIKDGRTKIRNPDIFQSFSFRGKHRFIKYSYDSNGGIITVHINKHYYLTIICQRVYQLAILAKAMCSVWQQYMEQVKYFLKNITQDVQLISVDVLAITISKQFPIIGFDGRKLMRRYYLRQSNFQFRSNLAFKPRQEEFLFGVCWEDYEAGSDRDQVPEDWQYYKAPRLNFIDDMHTNQSLVRRFIQRFVPFHQAFNLFDRQIPPQAHKDVRQFYRKCVHHAYFYAMRLKKIGFFFPVKKIHGQRQKTVKMSLYLYVEDEAYRLLENNMQQSFQKNYFSIETYYPEISDRTLNQVFQKRLKSQQFNQQQDDKIIQFNLNPQKRRILIRPRNQATYCRILNQFSFFLDRVFFRIIEARQKKKNNPHNYLGQVQISVGSIAEDSIPIRLPLSEEYTLNQSKYIHYYSIQIRSNNIKRSIDIVQKQVKDYYNYESQIHQIKVIRKKKAHNDQSEKQHDFFQKNPGDFKGLKVYLNSLLSAWNARQVYQDIIDFSSLYLNIVTEKLKDKVGLKNVGRWPSVIGGMEALIHSLSESFNTKQTTIKLYITQGFQDNKEGIQPGFVTDLMENDCVMTMTFILYKLTKSGWQPSIPACTFFFKVYKTSIILFNSYGQKLTTMLVDFSKKRMQMTYKQPMRQIYEKQNIIPRNYYQPQVNP